MPIGMVLFGIIVVIIAALVLKRHGKMENSELATYVVLIAWGSLFWGLALSKCAR